MRPFGSPAALLLVLLMVSLSSPLAAISVFDVIRLSQDRYTDEEIVRLIRSTDSRFLLTAEDTIRLRKAAVTEPVIREMLSRPAPERQAEPPASKGAANRQPPAAALRGPGEDPRAGSRAEPLFSGSPYQETGAVHPAHATVEVAGIDILIVRDRAGFSSPLARARAVAGTLNGLAAHASGRFAARAAGRDSKVTFERSESPATDVVMATPADVAAYRAAGHRKISAEALASFWAALLNDYWAIGVAGEPPRFLIDSREGQALERLSRAVRVRTGSRDTAAMRAALGSLGRIDREHLRRLPTAVPEDLNFPVRRSP